MRAVILSARAGGHTTELLRALTERGHSGDVRPYEGLVARLGNAPVEAGLQTRLALKSLRWHSHDDQDCCV